MTKFDKYIKNLQGDKVPHKTTTVNIETRHLEFIKSRNLNLSLIVRDLIESMIRDSEEDRKIL